MADRFTEADKKLAMERMKYKVANNLKDGDRLTQRDLENAKKIVKARQKYLVKDNEALGGVRTEDRLTQRDIENATKTVKEVKEFSKGSKKPIKAVAGVLAGLAAGVAPGIIGLGMLANKKMKKKSAVAEPNDEKYAMNDKSPIVDLYQKATGPAKMRTGGDVVIGKGGDYIKDLID